MLSVEAVAAKLESYLCDSSAESRHWCDPLRLAYRDFSVVALLLSARRRLAVALGALHARCGRAAVGLQNVSLDVLLQCMQLHRELMLASSEQLPWYFALCSGLASQRYVDPDILAARLTQLTQRTLCQLGDSDALVREQRERRDALAHERQRQRDAVANANRIAAIQAASRGDASTLARLLDEQPLLATQPSLLSLYPFGDHVGLRIGDIHLGGHRYGDHTLLTLACEHCHAKCVALLLAAGASVRTRLQYSRRDVMHDLGCATYHDCMPHAVGSKIILCALLGLGGACFSD